MSLDLQPGQVIVNREAIVQKAIESVGQSGGQLVGRVIDAVHNVNSNSPHKVVIGIEQDGSALVILGAKEAQLASLPKGNIDDGYGVVYTREQQSGRGATKVELQPLIRGENNTIKPLRVCWP